MSLRFPILLLGFCCVLSTLTSGEERWPRVYVREVVARAAVVAALDGASQWLTAPACSSGLAELQDPNGIPLAQPLAHHGTSWHQYLQWISFYEGQPGAPCGRGDLIAFTALGSRVVFICPKAFLAVWRRDPPRAKALVMHEVLHTLGVAERPASAEQITDQVLRVCGRRLRHVR